MAAYALTIFLGAFLLFQVQPLIGKYILPWFGGGPGVWTTCMLFFQVLLLGGYAYAHFSTRFLRPRAQAVLHLLLLVAGIALLPITPGEGWKPKDAGDPTVQILGLLAASVGLPFTLLSATGPLLQHWFTRTNPGKSPYRLYALSNAGSLLALLSYPFALEPHLSRKAQALFWGWGLVMFALCCGACAFRLWRLSCCETTPDERNASQQFGERPRLGRMILWLLLPACASVLLLATTNKLCQDVAVIPFLWVLPLALYLFSFIVCFDNPRWYQRVPFVLALIVSLGLMCWALHEGTDASLRTQLAIYGGGLFVCCMVCHGELYRLRPEAKQLTSFYLMIAAGGALGGTFVAAVAPRVFSDYHELPYGMLLCAMLTVAVLIGDRQGRNSRAWLWLTVILAAAFAVGTHYATGWGQRQFPRVPKECVLGLRIAVWLLLVMFAAWLSRGGRWRAFRYYRPLACALLSVAVLPLAVALRRQGRVSDGHVVERVRNFYGVLTVLEYDRDDPDRHYFLLQHGQITHGLQFTTPTLATKATTYYCDGSGIELAFRALDNQRRRIGVVGLGTGSIAAHGRSGDVFRFYDINPEVRRIATTRFSYLSNSSAQTEIILGDARLTLEQESPQHFDLLVLDAFNGDAIPVHLLTREAFEIYGRHLNANGIVAVHVSNHYLNLDPVVANVARESGYELARVDYSGPFDDGSDDEEGEEWWRYSSEWILLFRDKAVLNSPVIQAASSAATNVVGVPLWTDDFASLYQILK